jgi:hypothetical protein
MRRLALLLLPLVVAPVVGAPAPFPKAERRPRESEQAKRDRLLHECKRRLDELGVKWRLERQSVIFNVQHPNGGGMGGSWGVQNGDLTGTLRRVVARVEQFLGYSPRPKS